jgi:hypothetical protein
LIIDEPNRGGAYFARDVLHLNVKQCVLEKAGFDDGFFDVVATATLNRQPGTLRYQ